MSVLKNKIDFALVFTATNANPNGDPLDGNRPRTDYRGIGEVSDVCLKRKIRNRLLDMGEEIFVQSDDRRNDEYRSLRDRADACAALSECAKKIAQKQATTDDYVRIACQTWYDVRAFGQVFAFGGSKKKKKGGEEEEGSDAVSIGIRGPVSIQSAFSRDTVNITSIQITKSVNLETQPNPDKKAADTMGMKHRVDFGLYTTFGSINVQQAEKTGFTEEDADKLKNALLTLFVNDETSARPSGSMEVVKLVWWKHNCGIGQYSPAQVHRLLRIEHNSDIKNSDIKDGDIKTPRSLNDYNIVVDQLPGLDYEVLEGQFK